MQIASSKFLGTTKIRLSFFFNFIFIFIFIEIFFRYEHNRATNWKLYWTKYMKYIGKRLIVGDICIALACSLALYLHMTRLLRELWSYLVILFSNVLSSKEDIMLKNKLLFWKDTTLFFSWLKLLTGNVICSNDLKVFSVIKKKKVFLQYFFQIVNCISVS